MGLSLSQQVFGDIYGRWRRRELSAVAVHALLGTA